MRIVPSSTINLYSGVDIDMEEQLAFSSRANQLAYFGSKLVRAQTPCTMVRKTGMLRIELDNQLKSQIKSCNYISFINPDFDNKEVYGRILDYDYVNNETVDIAYGIDYWQTWMFDVTFKDSYIEREHLSETLYNIAEINPYSVSIPEFRTAETLPINGETEKFLYDIAPDANDYLDYDGFKVGKLMEDTLGVSDKIGVLLKLANIDFEDLDSTFDVNIDNWYDFEYRSYSPVHIDYSSSQGNLVTLPIDLSTYITSVGDIFRVQVTLNNGPLRDCSINYIVDGSYKLIADSLDMPEGTNYLPFDDLNDYKITAEVSGGYFYLKYELRTSGFDFDYTVMTTHIEMPSEIFKNILDDIANQDCGYWQLPYGVYKYLHDTYGLIGMNGFKQNGSWVYNGYAMTPFGSNDFKNKCIYIYDENGGAFESDPGTSYYSPISTLLSKLTLWNCVSSIVNMFAIPNDIMLMSGVKSSGEAWKVKQKSVKTELNVTNKKLMLYPFSYLRLVMPNGDVKELRFEDFIDVRGGGDDCNINLLLDISDAPILIVAPVQYKVSGMSKSSANDCNIREAVFYKQFPTAPYIIDAYLAQIANYTSEILKSNTLEQLYNYATDLINVNKTNERIHDLGVYSGIGVSVIEGGKDFSIERNALLNEVSGVTGAGGLGRSAVAGINTAAGQYSYGANLTAQRKQLERIGQERRDAGDVFRGDVAGAIGNQLFRTRGAYACDKYIASNGVGTTNFNVLSFMDIIFMRVTLNNVMLERFDNYFTHYGYTSGRCGIPRVCAFVNGSTDNDEIPHWLPVDGKPCTYIKTSDCRVTHSMLPVEAQIKAMFDSGVRMINGDPSTP